MSSNLGYQNPLSFAQPTPVQTVTMVTPNTSPSNLDTGAIANEVLKTIASLNKNQSEVNLNTDKNPLDNIIINEVIDLLSYRKLSRSDIEYALAQIGDGQDPSPNFSMEEHIILLSQARDLEFITEDQYLVQSASPSGFWGNYQEAYLKVLKFQLSLPATIPTIDELKVAGIVQLILTTVRDNPEVVIDENLIKRYTEQYINNLLLSSEFIGYEKAQRIYNDPLFIMNILDKQTLNYLLFRTKQYLNFITDAKITEIMSWHSGQFNNIGNVFSPTQIRLIIDKELDIKNMIFKTLSMTEVTKFFNELAEKFKVDFAETFTEEKLKGLIELTIQLMYPQLTIPQIYENIATTFGITITETKISSIEEYLQNY